MMSSLLQIAIAFDQLVNTFIGGWADETISARLYRNKNNSWWWAAWYNIVNTIFFWQENHCRRSFSGEKLRKQLPHMYRDNQSE